MTEPRQIAVVRNYDEFKNALRARADELQMSRNSIDHLAGLAQGHTSHILQPAAIKNIGPVSFGPLLQVMGLIVVLVEDPEQLAIYAARAPQRAEKNVNASGVMLAKKTRRKYRKFAGNSIWGKTMKARQVLTLSDVKRREIAITAAKTRWWKPGNPPISPDKSGEKPSTLTKSKKKQTARGRRSQRTTQQHASFLPSQKADALASKAKRRQARPNARQAPTARPQQQGHPSPRAGR